MDLITPEGRDTKNRFPKVAASFSGVLAVSILGLEYHVRQSGCDVLTGDIQHEAFFGAIR